MIGPYGFVLSSYWKSIIIIIIIIIPEIFSQKFQMVFQFCFVVH